jgi:4-alpha-glucanotransferase
VPLASIRSSADWGIGEIGDLVPMAAWLRDAGLDLLQLLPVNEMASGERSPYSAQSALAIDPIFISVGALEDFYAAGGEAALDASARAVLATVRASERIAYEAVRAVKRHALRLAFERFLDAEWRRGTPRARRFRAFLQRQRWWLDDYALFRVLHDVHEMQPWWEWPDGQRDRVPAVLDQVRLELAHELLYVRYLQWVAHAQWTTARAEAAPVGFVGDLPFMVSADSADVWARQDTFARDATVGTPPDAFSETGQDWGLPVYQWEVMARDGFEWLRARARRAADLYAAYRIDHLVGFYRTYVRPIDGSPAYFVPEGEAAQQRLGEAILLVFQQAGARIIAEDLGTVPDFVRASLASLGVPGYRVLRWEREWHDPGQPFREPAAYPAASLATTGTHDTESLAAWWDESPEDVRQALLALSDLAALGFTAGQAFDARLRDALLELLIRSGSDFVIFPIQDVFGWRDRINTPATVGGDNWTWRLPWPVETWSSVTEAAERADAMRGWTKSAARAVVPAGGRRRTAAAR